VNWSCYGYRIAGLWSVVPHLLEVLCVLSFSASSVIPAISTVFRLPVTPCTIRSSRLGRPRHLASSAINASLAAPSTGGAIKRALSTPCSHAKLFLLLRGTTCTMMRIHLPARRQRLQQQYRYR